jgi:hypothetical protein
MENTNGSHSWGVWDVLKKDTTEAEDNKKIMRIKENGKMEEDETPVTTEGFIIHRILPSDTLQGIAIKYGVQVFLLFPNCFRFTLPQPSELKKSNRIWGNDLFGKKDLVIPTTVVKHKEYLQRNSNKSVEGKDALVARFVREIRVEKPVAEFCLSSNNWNYSQSVKFFKEQELANRNISNGNGDSISSKPPIEIEIVIESNGSTKSLSQSPKNLISFGDFESDNGHKNPMVLTDINELTKKASKSILAKHVQEEENLFDL